MRKISVCIATHERPEALQRALSGLADQIRPTDEIVVSDSSTSAHSRVLVESFAAMHPEVRVKHVRAVKRALPWQRWWAFQHSTSEIVLFLDDDIELERLALQMLEGAYNSLPCEGVDRPTGVGFLLRWADDTQPGRNQKSLKERWVGTARYSSGTITPGGLPVSSAGMQGEQPVKVDHLSGGAMSFRRDVLHKIGLLDNLVALYEQGIGRTEDSVLCSSARHYGQLYLLTQPLAFHPTESKQGKTTRPYATDGWRMGVTGTWGRAHTMCWLASDRSACLRQWLPLASLECGRCLLEILKRPLRWANWERLAGAIFGTTRALVKWHTIPPAPKSGQEISKGKSDFYELAS